jgi:hypothetical protein
MCEVIKRSRHVSAGHCIGCSRFDGIRWDFGGRAALSRYHTDVVAHALHLKHNTTHPLNYERLGPVSVMITVPIFGLLPNPTALELKTGAAIKAAEV